MNILYTPLQYLFLKNEYLKKYKVTYPIIFTLVVFIVSFIIPKEINIFGTNGLIAVLNQFLSVLVAFYIASLAVVASLQGPGMDELTKGKKKIYFKSTYSTDEVNGDPITRRQLLSKMFGYLTFISVILYMFGLFSIVLKPNLFLLIDFLQSLEALKTLNVELIFRKLFTLSYTLLAGSLLFTSLLSLHYLSDRIHRN